MISCGCDLSNIARWQSPSERLIRRILTPEEITTLLIKFSFDSLDKLVAALEQNTTHNTKQIRYHLASRFAAKEAISKALGCGICADFSFQDVCIKSDEFKRPYAEFNSNVEKKFHIKECSISISHDEPCALAMCVINRF